MKENKLLSPAAIFLLGIPLFVQEFSYFLAKFMKMQEFGVYWLFYVLVYRFL